LLLARQLIVYVFNVIIANSSSENNLPNLVLATVAMVGAAAMQCTVTSVHSWIDSAVSQPARKALNASMFDPAKKPKLKLPSPTPAHPHPASKILEIFQTQLVTD